MIQRINKLNKRKVLIIDDELLILNTANGRAVRALVNELQDRNFEVIEAISYDDALSVIISDAAISCVLLDWTLGDNDEATHQQGTTLLQEIRKRNASVPVFLIAEKGDQNSFTIEAMSLANEFIWMLEDTASFLGGRIEIAIHHYFENLLPPFTKALINYTENSAEYSWAAPGHQGGIAFTKSPVGRVFFDFFGENLFRTDTGIERTPLGSLLDHEGPVKESEAYVAKVFGSHLSYNMLNGTSGSNRAVFIAAVADGQYALCDRNCHKSIEQSLTMTSAIPVFFIPTRNRFGIIGPIPAKEFSPEVIQSKINNHALKSHATQDKPVYAVVTNSTYDGMCYNSKELESLLAPTVDQIHLDEAWYAYARFNPLYKDRYGLRGKAEDHPKDAPTIFVTHSTHKLLAALSQSSYIHVRNGRKPIEHSRFNESYLLQSTTSPLYAIIASNEIGAAMMDGPQGEILTQEVIDEAVDFRQALARTQRAFHKKKDWFFGSWNAPTVTDPETGKQIDFADAPKELLSHDSNCWVLKPGDAWHGFDQMTENWCMLDPIKAGILCPGMEDNGKLSTWGIPAAVVSSFLYAKGIIPSRTTDFMVLCLFSVGNTKGKWGTLINALLEFKRHYDENSPLTVTIPDLPTNYPDRYGKMGLKDLADEMFHNMRESNMDKWQTAAFSQLPTPVTTPRVGFQKLMSGEVELLPLDKLAGRTSAVGVIPYPPGIPIIMPGESFGPADGPWLSYIRSLQEWGTKFPGFEKVVEGSEMKDGTYHVWCLK